MSTPEESFEIAVEPSTDAEARSDAIDALESANECDMLAELVRRDDVQDAYREQALTNLAHPQCKFTLRKLVDTENLPSDLQEQAESLVADTPDDSGAGP